ncbi:nucleolar complex protein-like protein [Hapsidospora chrysogenum ATCC 11550]|uniref:Nucleolar complex protein-like protein n=1 Tax=Hapsidospora chrysogenum (strain ATCC 11550 / CBS 779.69 / DSM 880 / IAM 14645 / JCM 23072 / IMI 49137) TaxID=857340 RepID=A0A086TET5_HAPC1|nr:nucleolar complex protein-like protein [Hapsidospora chrysogenum ATCC 11550]
MAGSQLKRLKASLREQGIVGPQQSKKQKRKNAQDERARNEKRLQRGVVLEGIREQFNPFDLKHAKAPKFEVTSNRPTTSAIKGRPGQAKAASEEKRRQTLLADMQHRHKVGGILDQRFGENDPTMTPEEKMLERFAREKLKSHKKSSMFDLEEEDESMEGLTHGGKALTFDDEPADDFEEEDLDAEDSDGSVRESQRLKRVRAMAASDGDEQPERKKSKKEIMNEVIAKSKFHKHERQQAKADDDDLRAEIDQELPDLRLLLAQNAPKRQPDGDTEAPPAIRGIDRDAFDKNFDLEVKKLAQDRRAQPADRTKTEEEKAEDESRRLRELEEKRQKRMRGETVSDSDESEDNNEPAEDVNGQDELDDEDDDFGLGSGIRTRPTATELGFDDEDDFIIDDDLVASGSDLEPFESDDEFEQDDDASEGDEEEEEEEDDEFTKGLLNEEEARNLMFKADSSSKTSALEKGDENGLPYTFPCPQSRGEFEAIIKDYPHGSLPTLVQRIRALYHPKLDSKNKEYLANFSTALVDFVSSPFNARSSPESWPPFSVLESLIRHIHSLSKMFPIEIAQRFRHHLEEIGGERPLALEAGDLVLLTAVGTIFPTSDHFHQVVTPAMLTAGRYLGQKVPHTLADHVVGVYLSILSLQYQQLAKRFVPEVLNFILNTICAVAPVAAGSQLGRFPLHGSEPALRVRDAKKTVPRCLNFADCVQSGAQAKAPTEVKVAILDTALQVCDAAADTWTGKEAFAESFDQVLEVAKHLSSQKCQGHLPRQLSDRAEKLQTKLERMMRLATLARRPLELHHHRPLAIKTYIPKFEDQFDPDKHYDPDRERAELAKLRAEHKKERKGALRELRKDANFMAREKLKIKKAKDEAYEKKYKRLVAEIQSEEGREANEYEREKKARKRAKNR